MNTYNNRAAVLLIAAIMASVATATIFFLPITPTYIVAYAFALLGVALFCAGNLYMLSNPMSYPWLLAFPRAAWQYLLAQLGLSAAFIARELLFAGRFPVGLFAFLHLLLLAVFAVKLLLLKGGKEMIEAKDAEMRQKVSVMRTMQADVESALRRNPEHEKPLRRVLEALKYSDPMSSPAAARCEEEIQLGIAALDGMEGNEPAKIPEICEKLLLHIADRNARVKLAK